MAINVFTDVFYVGLISTAAILVKDGIVYLRKRRREGNEAEKISVETDVLTGGELRERVKFYEEQLSMLEAKFKEKGKENDDLRIENDSLRAMIKQKSLQLDELQRKTNEILNDITFLKTELAAYKH